MVQSLADLEAKMAVADLAACSSDELRSLSVEADAGQRVIAGYQARIASAARRLEETGRGSTAEDTMRSGGTVSNKTAKRLSDRAGLGELLPAVGAGLEAGEVRPENVDTLAARTKRLSATERARLAKDDADLANKSAVLSPESFTRYLSHKLRGIKDPEPDDGLSPAQRQAKAAWLELERAFDGTWHVRGQLDDERGQQTQRLDRTPRHRHQPRHQPYQRQRPSHRIARPRPPPRHRLSRRRRLDTTGTTRGRSHRRRTDHDRRPPPTLDSPDLERPTHRPRRRPSSLRQRRLCDPHRPARCCPASRAHSTHRHPRTTPRPTSPLQSMPTRRHPLRRLRNPRQPLRGCFVNLFFEDGGDTEIENLLPISQAWHHGNPPGCFIHDKGWTIKMAEDRSLALWRPDGTIERRIPPPTPISRE